MANKETWKSTEFWASTLFSIGAIVASVANILDPKYAAILVAVSTGLYTISRGLAKKQ